MPRSFELRKADVKSRARFSLVITLGGLALQGCVPQDAANGPLACAARTGDYFGGEITEGAFDEGYGVISLRQRGGNDQFGSTDNQSFVHCASGVGLSIFASEQIERQVNGTIYDETRTILLDPAIDALRATEKSHDFATLVALTKASKLEGAFTRAYRNGTQSHPFDRSQSERCGCNLYYPGTVRQWPRNSEWEQYPAPKTQKELEALIRASQPAEKTEE